MKRVVLGCVCVLIGMGFGGGCAGGPRAVAAWDGVVSERVVGDWDDVWPALIVAGKSGEVGLLEEREARVEQGREVREWVFVTVRDEEMVARATRAAGMASGEILLETIGGDEVVARRVARAWAERVGALAGREWAPK